MKVRLLSLDYDFKMTHFYRKLLWSRSEPQLSFWLGLGTRELCGGEYSTLDQCLQRPSAYENKKGFVIVILSSFTAALSEPESQALHKHLKRIRPKILSAISVHSYGRDIYYAKVRLRHLWSLKQQKMNVFR